MGFIVFAQSSQRKRGEKSVSRLALSQLRCINAFFLSFICNEYLPCSRVLLVVFLSESIITISHKSFWIQNSFFSFFHFHVGARTRHHNLFRLFSGAPCCILRFRIVYAALFLHCLEDIAFVHYQGHKSIVSWSHGVSLSRRAIATMQSRAAMLRCKNLRWNYRLSSKIWISSEGMFGGCWKLCHKGKTCE